MGEKNMKKLETLFGIVSVLVLLVAAAVFGANTYTTEETDTEEASSEEQETQETDESVSDVSTMHGSVYVIENDLDPELEIGHVYMVSQKINEDVSAFGTDGGFAELNEVQERLYDTAEEYDEVEYDWLQEQVDNERYIAKEDRDHN